MVSKLDEVDIRLFTLSGDHQIGDPDIHRRRQVLERSNRHPTATPSTTQLSDPAPLPPNALAANKDAAKGF
jgi:hypothetical protein